MIQLPYNYGRVIKIIKIRIQTSWWMKIEMEKKFKQKGTLQFWRLLRSEKESEAKCFARKKSLCLLLVNTRRRAEKNQKLQSLLCGTWNEKPLRKIFTSESWQEPFDELMSLARRRYRKERRRELEMYLDNRETRKINWKW